MPVPPDPARVPVAAPDRSPSRARPGAVLVIATCLLALLGGSAAAVGELRPPVDDATVPALAAAAGAPVPATPADGVDAVAGRAGALPAVAQALVPAEAAALACQTPAGSVGADAVPLCVHDHAAPHTVAGTAGSAAAPAVAVACDGDGRSGNRIQAVYVRGSGRPDRTAQVRDRLRRVVAVANGVVTRSSDGRRALRVVTDSACAVDLPRLTVPVERLGSFGQLTASARAAGLTRSDRKYLLLVDDDRGCGLAEQYHDDQPGPQNRNNDGDMLAALWLPCWDGVLAAHEVVHSLGGVQPSAPRSTGAWSHCTDGHDVMCYPDGSGRPVSARCPSSSATLLDCGRDDYFSLAPAAGSYLTRAWNTAGNSFLIGGGPAVPTAPSAPTRVSSSRSGETVTLRWGPPEQARSGVAAYDVVDLAASGQVLLSTGPGELQAGVALEPWRSYRLAVRARNGVGVSGPSGDEPHHVGRAPETPRGLTALPAVTADGIGTQLSWRAAEHATEYVVWRDGSLVGRTASTSWTDPLPVPLGRSAVHSVHAVNAWGTSPAANATSTGTSVPRITLPLRLGTLTGP